ncbi:hypothetical protein U0C82_10540 [Fulvimarina sp. 2208YS6-2-32]|uniref:Thermonuclease family protein n=1 Tax=Fulvimarina uroteuthidis TaxID=3098149 RepID=A0ABU5I2H7_9HYPH|nr:hypothetical protein [Fulvimarina sp. 2208YS6-2-32]MDY8109575.1 hypothetical protein [Fulvimarina sp. 2208YS6-2-32]
MARFRNFLATAAGLAALTVLLLLAFPDERARRMADRPRADETAAQTATRSHEDGAAAGTAAGRALTERPKDMRTVAAPRGDAAPIGAPKRLPPRDALSTLAAPGLEPDDVRERLLSRPVAIDNAHIEIGEARIALPGVEPLSVHDQCGPQASRWPCGARARTAFRAFLRGRSIACTVPKAFGEAPGEIVSACSLAGADIGAWIVANGWGRAVPGGPYVAIEAEAKKAARGIWR